MCDIMAMGLLYGLIYSQCVWGGFGSNGSGHLKSDSIVPLMLRIVCYAMAGAPTLYYRSLGTVSTLLRKGNILGKSYF
jgi:hypothetical protein